MQLQGADRVFVIPETNPDLTPLRPANGLIGISIAAFNACNIHPAAFIPDIPPTGTLTPI